MNTPLEDVEVNIPLDGEVPAPDTDTTPKPAKPKRSRARDRAPNPKPPKVSRTDLTTQAIEDGLAQILTLPSIPCSFSGDEWAAEHFLTQGRATAKVIAETSERNPTLRRWCERALTGETTAVLFMAAISYLVPPLMHWGVIPAPNIVKEQLGVPVREDEQHPYDEAMAAAEQNGNVNH